MLELGGIAWMSGGIGRRLDGSMSNLSGKPTKLLMLCKTVEA
jgi:hypothetical protein